MVIPDGPFKGKEAILVSQCDCVLIEGEVGFCVRDGKLTFPLEDHDERDLRHVYKILGGTL